MAEIITATPQEITWGNAPAEYWWIDVGPFKDRLGVDGMAISVSSNDVCRAVLAQIQDRKYIDLRSPHLSAALDLLIAHGQPEANATFPGSGPITAEKKAMLLAPPTLETERFVKGLPQPVEA